MFYTRNFRVEVVFRAWALRAQSDQAEVSDELGDYRQRRLEAVLRQDKGQWGKLTDDELTQINGNREQLEGKLQAKYGYAKDKAKQEIDDWCNRTKTGAIARSKAFKDLSFAAVAISSAAAAFSRPTL